MSFLTLDFETFYSDKEQLGFKTQTTEEYIRDPRFEVIGVSVSVDGAPAVWRSGSHEEINSFLRSFDWEDSALLAHNTLFDGAILAWVFGITPAFYYDTLSMARAVHGTEVSGSLASLVKKYQLGEKGTEVVQANGKRRADFTEEELKAYGAYCCNDTNLTFKLFNVLGRDFPESEHELIDMTIRMFTHPVFEVDDALLVSRLEELREEKSSLLSGLMHLLQVGTEEEVRKKLTSNPKFAAILRELGVEPPMKISPKTKKSTYAFAKTDEGFLELQEHPDPEIQQLCSVRLGTRSTIEESRIARFIDIGARNRGLLPIPLKFYAAHTGRWGGMDLVNLQNLPSRNKKMMTLKRALRAPPDHLVLNCDSSQIEARMLAWLAKQEDVVQAFAEGRDVYCEDATRIFGRPITKANPIERFVGKTCLGSGTRVLTRRGWVPILQVKLTDQLWDGVEWVNHSGVSYMGQKPTIWLSGLELTPDHEVLTAPTKWESAQYALTHGSAFQSALALATSSLSATSSTLLSGLENNGVGNPCAAASVAGVSVDMQPITCAPGDLRHVMPAQNERLLINAGGNIRKLYQMIFTGVGSLIDSLRQLADATILKIATTITMVGVGSRCIESGETTTSNFLPMFSLFPDGTTLHGRWIASTTVKDTFPETYASLVHKRTREIDVTCSNLRPVFDILNSGLRSRFTVLTDRGPIIVHNCRLGLGFGTGAAKLQWTLKVQPPGADLELEECQRLVNIWRRENYKIVELWYACNDALQDLMYWEEGKSAYSLGRSCVQVTPEGIKLPNNMYIRYHNLRLEDSQYVYDTRKGPKHIWGGAMVENIVQALARIAVGEQMIRINQRHRVVLTVHDAAVNIVPAQQIQDAVEFVTSVMSTAPDWAPGLPVACEAKVGLSYGELAEFP